ncbi:DNA repair ATPase SMC5 [Sporobolomyces koalae]|uniref:DNA repair ATPase SMC5 n=1 Tax=Sporobolomyces koalae TaxID=500713 RepID=UPI003174A2F4
MSALGSESPVQSHKTRHRRKIASDDDDDHDEPASNSSSPASNSHSRVSTTNAHKRVKLEASQANGRANGVNGENRHAPAHEQGDDAEGEDGAIAPETKARAGEKAALIRDGTGYVTGSIVRIACHAFLTYDSVDFRPGPALNMIIGPNGTGKSTIACAIAIGLGFPSKVLGRQTKLSSFCKNDSNEDTWIEIELKGKPGKKNMVVRRYLSRDSEKTAFTVDGAVTAAKEVAERMEALTVQVGNLCTFLPQDRVAQFAMMGPVDLLRETEKAAGHVNLSAWHQILIDEWKAQKEKQIEVDTYQRKLDRASQKQAEAEKEVQQFRQRQQYEQDLVVVDVLMKYARYQDVFSRKNEQQTRKNILKNDIAQAEEDNKPFTISKDSLAQVAKASAGAQAELEKKIRKAQTAATKKSESIKRNMEESSELVDELKGLKREAENRKNAIKKYEKDIQVLSSKLEGQTEPAEADTEDIDRKIRAKTDERDAKKGQTGECQIEYNAIGRRLEELRHEAKTKQERIAHMTKAHAVREHNLAQFDPDCWKAVKWLRENSDRFKGRVFEPSRLSVFPKQEWNGKKLNVVQDPDIINMIEAPITMDAFRTFLFELREDYDFFMHEMADVQKLKLAGAEFNSEVINRQLTQENIESLGFDALACDLLTGPAPVIAWLANEHNLARTPIQLYRRSLDDARIAQNRSINRYYTRDGSVSVKISNYGNRNAMTESRALPRAKILSAGVDQGKVDQMTEDIEELKTEYAKVREKQEKLSTIGKELEEQVETLEEERTELKKEKEKLVGVRAQYFKAKVRLETAQKALAREMESHKKNTGQKKRDEIARDMKKVMAQRVKLVLQYKNDILEADQLMNAAIKLHLQALQAESDYRALETLARERDTQLDRMKRELEEVNKLLKELVAEGRRLAQEADEATVEDELKERVTQRRRDGGITVDGLETEKDEISAKLDCMIAISPAVLEQYKKRKDEIAELTEKVQEANVNLDESKTLIEHTRAMWLPEVQLLVNDVSKRFTASFDTLGLLGEVRLAPDEDYEKWGIEIMVSFRDKDSDSADVSLHVLTGSRQSGGERALSTVTYLLALAGLARAPFALVDEINQGMDQRAERQMHKMLVETTCNAEVGQYFLLTPKLLPDLLYHEKMKVLVINSGSFIPEDLSLKAMVEKRRMLNRTRGRIGHIEIPAV